MPIVEGKAAPDFTLKNQNDEETSLSQFKGNIVVVYFYPKDNTPGWTKEAIGFRELHETFEAAGAVILGISPDSTASHIKFIEKQKLNFTLLSDPEKEVMSEYGAFGEKMMYGKKTVGVIRSTVLVDIEGKVFKHWKRVQKAADHPAKVLEVIQKDMKA